MNYLPMRVKLHGERNSLVRKFSENVKRVSSFEENLNYRMINTMIYYYI